MPRGVAFQPDARQLHAGHPGQADVGDQYIETCGIGQGQRCFGMRHRDDLAVPGFHDRRHALADIFVVFYV